MRVRKTATTGESGWRGRRNQNALLNEVLAGRPEASFGARQAAMRYYGMSVRRRRCPEENRIISGLGACEATGENA